MMVYRAVERDVKSKEGWELIETTEILYDEINPTFKPLEINLNRLTNGKEATRIRFSVYSAIDEENEQRILYGHCETSIKEIRMDALRERDLIDEEANKGMKEAGTIKLNEFSQIESASFVEYLKGGW